MKKVFELGVAALNFESHNVLPQRVRFRNIIWSLYWPRELAKALSGSRFFQLYICAVQVGEQRVCSKHLQKISLGVVRLPKRRGGRPLYFS